MVQGLRSKSNGSNYSWLSKWLMKDEVIPLNRQIAVMVLPHKHKYESWHFIYYSAKVIDIFVKGSIMNWKVVCTRTDVNDSRRPIEKMNLNAAVDVDCKDLLHGYTILYTHRKSALMIMKTTTQDLKPKHVHWCLWTTNPILNPRRSQG